MNILRYIEHCVTWRDLYSLSEELGQNGLMLTNTINGTRVLCAIRDGRIKASKLFDDYIFIEGKNNELIPERVMEIIKDFVDRNATDEKLVDNSPTYIKNIQLYGKPITYGQELKLLGEQQTRYLGSFIRD